MVLESCMICLDNSEWMRNGDYAPSRLGAQQDAATALVNDRSNSNAENTVGVLTMAGKSVDMLVSPTEEVGKILATFAGVSMSGCIQLCAAIQIAQLALKHRKNKNGGQRIIVFIGSPVKEDTATLVKVGKVLKKNNVAVDVVNMGDNADNDEKLKEFIESANSGDNSHLLNVSPGVSPVDALLASPLVHLGHTFGSGTVGGASGSGGAFEEYGGIDPSVDPELAMAIRVSLEQARLQEESRNAQSGATSSSAAPSGIAIPAEEEDEEALMQRALELSMLDISPESSSPVNAAAAPANVPESSSVDEDEEMRIALQMSMAEDELDKSGTSSDGAVDTQFLKDLLGTVDVDPNDPLIQAALAQLKESEEPEKKRKRDDEKDK